MASDREIPRTVPDDLATPAQRFDLTDKVAVVTGGARGIGRALSWGLAAAGADVVIASRNLEHCETVAREIAEATGRRTYARRLHVAHWDEIAPFAADVWEHMGKVDVLVNNAGMSPLYDDLREVTEDYWEKVVGVNLKGPFKMTVELGCRMFEGDGGSIINLSTLASLNPMPNTIPYGAAKAGLNVMAKGFVQAWGRKVRVNTIIPGGFRTDVTRFWASIPEGIGEPEEMVGTVLYLASDASSYTTGAEIRVAGPARY
jgi:NAD(P)-dependent dehydrogenase (short-subunit alcohol dehydrogenase family)